MAELRGYTMTVSWGNVMTDLWLNAMNDLRIVDFVKVWMMLDCISMFFFVWIWIYFILAPTQKTQKSLKAMSTVLIYEEI